jgi:hypothetical protein
MISILFSKPDYFQFELCCITVTFPHVRSKNTSEQVQTPSKNEYWHVWSTDTPIKEVLSLSLLQAAGGKPIFPRVKRSDRLKISEIWIVYHEDWPRCRTEGWEIQKKPLKRVAKFGCEKYARVKITWVNTVIQTYLNYITKSSLTNAQISRCCEVPGRVCI